MLQTYIEEKMTIFRSTDPTGNGPRGNYSRQCLILRHQFLRNISFGANAFQYAGRQRLQRKIEFRPKFLGVDLLIDNACTLLPRTLQICVVAARFVFSYSATLRIVHRTNNHEVLSLIQTFAHERGSMVDDRVNKRLCRAGMALNRVSHRLCGSS